MKILTRTKLATLLSLGIIIAYGAYAIFSHHRLVAMTQELRHANKILNSMFLLRMVTYDFLLYETERAQKQWWTVYSDLQELLEQPESRQLQAKYGLESIRPRLTSIRDAFSALVQSTGRVRLHEPPDDTTRELQSRLATQLLLNTQEIISAILNVAGEINDRVAASLKREDFTDVLALLLLALFIMANLFFLLRSVVRPVLRLREGVEIIGRGNLEHQVGMDTQDEIGELSRAFDQMTAHLRESEHRLRHLTGQLLTAQEMERKRVALDLHDDLGQSLMVLKMQMRGLEPHLAQDLKIREDFSQSLDYITSIIDKLRHICHELRPSVLDLGLGVALESLANEFQDYHGIEVSLEGMDELSEFFDKQAQILIYRVIQESLSNVAKHSGASRVSLNIKRQAKKISFLIVDNGLGFDVAETLAREARESGLGLASIDERVRMLGGGPEDQQQKGAWNPDRVHRPPRAL